MCSSVKRLLCLLLSLSLLFLCSCSVVPTMGDVASPTPVPTEQPTPTPEPTPEPTPTPVPTPAEMSSKELAAYGQKCTVTVEVETITGKTSRGTGFFIDNEGTFVTSYHVIDLPSEISVQVNDGGSYPLEKVVAFNPVYDLAILKINYASNDYLELAEEVAVGEPVYAVGSAKGELTGTFTTGIVSSVDRTVGMIECIQTDAAISNGNSGGPLMNVYGEVVGINAFSFTDGQNLNLAVKASMLDNIGEHCNYSMNEMREWYEVESSRSYSPFDDDDTFYYSLVNTYTTVTGQECVRCLVDGDIEYGYHDMGTLYLYEYDSTNYDIYRKYIRNQGFEFDYKEVENEIEMNYYNDKRTGLTMMLAVQQSTNEVVVSLYYD